MASAYHVVSVDREDVVWVAGEGDEAEAIAFSLYDVDHSKGGGCAIV